MKKEEAQRLLRRYRLGQCTDRELEIINQWYRSFDDEDLPLPDHASLNIIKAQMLKNITDTISHPYKNGRGRRNHEKNGKKINFLRFENITRIAAVFVIAITLTFLFYKEVMVNKKNENVGESRSSKENLPSTIYLSDGSIVKLKEDSRLYYPKRFTGDTREVTLTGEAFFEVAKNKSKPFIIHAANLTTQVLGTSFNIKAYENDASAEVSVVTGKVSVSINETNSNEIILIPNQKAIYHRKKHTLVQDEVKEMVSSPSEQKTKLIFNETPLKDIIQVLNLYYHVNIRLGNKDMKHCLITAELTDEPLEVSLKILTKAIGAGFKINYNEIKITGKGCSM